MAATIIRLHRIFPVAVVALAVLTAAGQDRASASLTTTSRGFVAGVSEGSSTPTPATPPSYFEPELTGVYRPDGKFKAFSKRDHLSELDDHSVREAQRRTEVPDFVDLRAGGRVVEDYAPPAYARKPLEPNSLFANVRNDLIAFLYGREPILRAPTHLTTDSRQRLIISDPDQCAIHVLDGKDSFRIVGGGPQRRLQRPNGIAVDGADNIYVADGERALILVYDPQGRFLRYIGEFRGESIFADPTGIALDRNTGRLYVLDSPADQLIVLDLAGNVLKRVGNSRDRKRQPAFDFPTEIAIANNKVAVLDSGGSRIQILDREGNFLKVLKIRNVSGPPVCTEMGLALDSGGNVYVGNLGQRNVMVYHQDGRRLGSFGPPAIQGIWIDAAGRVYLADSRNSRVVVFQSRGAGESRTRYSMSGSGRGNK